MVIMTNRDYGWKLNTRVVEQVMERYLAGCCSAHELTNSVTLL